MIKVTLSNDILRKISAIVQTKRTENKHTKIIDFFSRKYKKNHLI